MNVVVNSQRLAAELRLLNKVVPNNPAIAILSHVLIDAQQGELKFYATDLEVGLATSCHAQTHEAGRVALPVEKLSSMIEQCPDADVVIAADTTGAKLQCGNFRSRLQVLPHVDFPTQPTIDPTSCVVSADSLRAMIEKVRTSISTTGGKFVLQGALLKVQQQIAAMVATDSRRLTIAMSNSAEGEAQAILPLKVLELLASQTSSQSVQIAITERNLQFTVEGRTIFSRVLDGKFPAYERIIPSENEKKVLVSRNILMAALKRVILAADGNRAVNFTLSTNTLTLNSASFDIGSAEESVAAQYEGEKLQVVLNGNFMLDFLDVSQHESITIALKDPKSAALLTDGDDHLGVVMTMTRN